MHLRCTSPRTVGYKPDGKTLSWSLWTTSIEYAGFQLPCGKCVECRLEYGRQWAVRCVHEASMYENNSFITLTYDDQHLKSEKLIYEDFQKFMKRLRKIQNEPIGVFVTGEYGEKTKRPHWHAIIFNWYPRDATYLRSNELGDRIFSSATLEKIWGKGKCELGSVTFRSAGYCARYAAKKLIHGKDQDHEYHPISKKSSKHAIGKKWLEKNWRDVFTHGVLVLQDGTTTSIPRYYEKWFKENHPDAWLRYLAVKAKKADVAKDRAHRESLIRWPYERNRAQRIITNATFKMLQNGLKL